MADRPMGWLLAVAMLSVFPLTPALAHSGGLNAQGYHNNRKTGDYHCTAEVPRRLPHASSALALRRWAGHSATAPKHGPPGPRPCGGAILVTEPISTETTTAWGVSVEALKGPASADLDRNPTAAASVRGTGISQRGGLP